MGPTDRITCEGMYGGVYYADYATCSMGCTTTTTTTTTTTGAPGYGPCCVGGSCIGVTDESYCQSMGGVIVAGLGCDPNPCG